MELHALDGQFAVAHTHDLTVVQPHVRERKLLGALEPFKQRGKSGAWVSDLMPHTAAIADERGFFERGQRVAPEALRENLSLLDEGSLFLIPLDHLEKAGVLLRETFGHVLP